MPKDKKRQEIADLGEDGLISAIKGWCPPVTPDKSLLTGIGDDAALLQPKANYQQLFCSDMLTEGVHFDMHFSPLPHVGYKALVANISDMVAMNGKATHALVSIGISNRFCVEDIRLLYAGMQRACDRYGVSIVGGDTTSSRVGLTLSVSLLGEVLPTQVVHRKGAQIGDYLCVTGDLGAAYVGLLVLQEQQKIFEKNGQQPDLTPYKYVVERCLKPEACTLLKNLIVEKNLLPTAMIDVSDGLAIDLRRLCEASQVGVLLDTEQLPIAPQTSAAIRDGLSATDLSPLQAACYGGEDYELLFTLSAEDYKKIQANNILPIHHIGQIQPIKAGICMQLHGKQVPIHKRGWNHFPKNQP